MKPVGVVEGPILPLDRADVDTDQIMPKQFLKRIERTGFGEFVFHDWRADPGFVMNDPRYAGAKVLVSGANFGSGSSREHAPWGLQQYGFDAVIAPSFADIFRGNCAKIGLLAVELDAEVCARLCALAEAQPGATVRVDLLAQRVTTGSGTPGSGTDDGVAGGVDVSFAIDPFAKHLLVEGLDDIGLTLRHDGEVAAFEARRPAWLPTASAR